MSSYIKDQIMNLDYSLKILVISEVERWGAKMVKNGHVPILDLSRIDLRNEKLFAVLHQVRKYSDRILIKSPPTRTRNIKR